MKMDYDCLNDDAVLAIIHSGDSQAMEYLLEKYKGIVLQKARTLFLIGGDRDDLIQEGMIGLYKAIRDFNSMDSTQSFRYFAELCITRQMYNAIKASLRQKNIPLNTYISIYSPVHRFSTSDDKPTPLLDIILPKENLNPEEILIDKETKDMIEYELGKRLSSLEKQVFSLYVNGLKYNQIASHLNREPKSIDNTLQRIRNKLSSLLLELN